MKPNISDAIIALGFNGGFKIKEKKIAVWYRDDVQPAHSEIENKLAELQADYDAKKYQRDRIYPRTGEQLDEIYHKGIDEWKKTIKAVKDKHPKP